MIYTVRNPQHVAPLESSCIFIVSSRALTTPIRRLCVCFFVAAASKCLLWISRSQRASRDQLDSQSAAEVNGAQSISCR